MTKGRATASPSSPPKWIKPQLTRLVDDAPADNEWLHEIKFDGYRMHGRVDRGKAQLRTRTGLDWSHRYRGTIEAPSERPQQPHLLGCLPTQNLAGQKLAFPTDR